jgi:hypothetical protein
MHILNMWLTDRTIGELDDIAQCLIAIMLVKQLSPRMLQNDHDIQKTVEDIIGELISLGRVSEERRYWESVYVSSYVLIALLSYLEIYPGSNLKEELIKTVRYGLVALEERFSNNWDQPQDTALALHLYILAGVNNVIKHDLLPEIIFQGFRWLCDSKQRYQNGSIQRNIHYTVLFANSLPYK